MIEKHKSQERDEELAKKIVDAVLSAGNYYHAIKEVKKLLIWQEEIK